MRPAHRCNKDTQNARWPAGVYNYLFESQGPVSGKKKVPHKKIADDTDPKMINGVVYARPHQSRKQLAREHNRCLSVVPPLGLRLKHLYFLYGSRT